MTENWSKICRLCLRDEESLISIFDKSNSVPISEIVSDSIGLDITQYDGLPSNICQQCISKTILIQEQRKMFIKNDQKLRKILKENIKIEFISTLALEVETDCMGSDVRPDLGSVDPVITDKNEHTESDGSVDDSSEFDAEYSEADEECKTPKQKKRKTPKRAKKDDKKVKVPDEPRRFENKCFICDEVSETPKVLIEHLAVHMDKLPFECKECVTDKIVIKSLKPLNAHLKMHTQPFKCDHCDKRYACEGSRKSHFEDYHLGMGKNERKCEICGKIYTSKGSFRIHMKTHTGEFECKTCKKTFGTRRNLRRHEQSHSNVKTYECAICNRMYKDIWGYTLHMKRHNNEKAFECNLCAETFFTASCLSKHVKNHQGDDENDAETSNKINWKQYYKVHIVKETRERRFECNFCQIVKTKATYIVKHISTAHLQPFHCSFCGQRFGLERSRLDHENIHTGAMPHICEICGKAFRRVKDLYAHKKKCQQS